MTTFQTAPDGTLGDATTGEIAFTGDHRGFLAPEETDGATFRTPALEQDLVLAGQPALELAAAVSTPRVHLIANVFDESPDGTWRRISQCTINPELRNGLAQRALVLPGQRYDMAPPCFAMAHRVRAGHRLALRVTTSDPDKVPLFAADAQVRVFTGAGATTLKLPVVENAVTYPDTVPLELEQPGGGGPAQAPFSGDVTTKAPGAGTRTADVTSQYVVFEVPEGVDNASATIAATTDLPADVDLYLQRRLSDGSWSGDLASGATGELNGDRMTTGRLPAGVYRIEVHNWAGPPANRVALSATFFNSAGEEG
jgi:hypothetical protein